MRAQRKSLKPITGTNDVLDFVMVLLRDVVQVLDLPNSHRRFPSGVQGLEHDPVLRRARSKKPTVLPALSAAPTSTFTGCLTLI